MTQPSLTSRVLAAAFILLVARTLHMPFPMVALSITVQ